MTKITDKSYKMFKEFEELIEESRNICLELGSICGAQKRLIERLEKEKKAIEFENIRLTEKLIERNKHAISNE